MRLSIVAPRVAARVEALLAAALLVTGCAQELDVQPLDTQIVQAVFDPSLGIVPTPNDLAKNPETGLLAVPVADEAQAPAQATVDRYLNSLDGFPVSATLAVCFSGQVDPQSLDGGFVVVELPKEAGSPAKDISDEVGASEPEQSTDCPVLSKSNCDPTAETSSCEEGQTCLPTNSNVPTLGRCASAGYKVVLTRDKPWDRATTYVTLATSALKALDGRAVIPSATFELAASKEPVCEWDDQAQACTQNYAAAVASAAARTVAAENPELEGEPLQAALRAAELSGATAAERLRRGFDQLLSASLVDRSQLVVAWSFTTVSMVEAQFNPSPDPTQTALPGPGNDIVLNQGTGKVNLPLDGVSAQERQLRMGLNTLDGFSTTAAYFATFSGDLDAATVGRGGEALLLDMSALTSPPIAAQLGYADKAQAVTMTPERPLREGRNYVALLLSNTKTREITDTDGGSRSVLTAESGGGLADPEGRRVVASSAFALVKSKAPLVDDSGKSTVSVLDDQTAALLEPLRASYDALLGIIETTAQIDRDDVVLMWTFRTQTFTKQLTQLRALPWSLLDTDDGVDPRFSGVHVPDPKSCAEASAPCWPEGVPKDEVGAWVPNGSFQSWFALDPATGALRADPTKGKATREPGAVALPPEEQHVPFFLVLPKGLPCDEGACPDDFTCDSDRCVPEAEGPGWPLVLFQHGITRSKADVFAIVNTLAQAGYATLAFDTIYHGDRSVCLATTDCIEGSACDVATRRCCKTVGEDLDCQVSYFVGQGGLPEVSGGAAFLNTDNPFAIRDNLRQHVIDAAALLRAVQLGASAGLKKLDGTAAAVKLDPQRIHYLGVSLGGMLGVPLLATDPLNQGDVRRAVLNVAGAPLAKIFEDTQDSDFKALVDGMLAARGAERGSKGALELFHTLQWILDPADPANFARFVTTDQLKDEVQSQAAGKEVLVPTKDVLCQVANEDTVIPSAQQTALASWLDVDVSKTSYDAGHGFLLQPDEDQPGLIAAAQAQVVVFLSTGGVCEPQPTQGKCE